MASRTIEQGVSLLTAGEIRVAVLPVGHVPRDILDEYLELINRYHHVSLSATRSFYRESPAQQAAVAAAATGLLGAIRPPFQFMDWSNSHLHLKFLQSEDARVRTRLPDLYPGRQVLAILGVVYCPNCTSVKQAYDEFKRMCRSYPEAFVTKCFVFEPSEDHIRQERDCQQLPDLVMFPPGGLIHLEQHLEVWMHDLAATLLTEFEKWMLTASPMHLKFNSYADSAEFTGASLVLDEMTKRLAAVDGDFRERQRRGRLLKAKGDMCLLSGSPRDAAEHYRTAQEIAKSCNDWVWYGAALEGIAAARVHEVISSASPATISSGVIEEGNVGDAGGSSSSSTTSAAGGGGKQNANRKRDSVNRAGAGGGGAGGGGAGYMTTAKWELLRRSDVEAFVKDCFTEARVAYKKKGGVAALLVEQHLKLARLLAGLRGCNARREVGELLSAMGEVLPTLPAAEDRLMATVEYAQILGMVGFCRKRLLLLWHAMEQARVATSVEKSELLRIAVRALEPPEDPQAQDPDDLPHTHWSISRFKRASTHCFTSSSCLFPAGTTSPGRGWEAVQTVLLEAVLVPAKQARAPVEAWEAAAALLREHNLLYTPQYQGVLLDTLAQASLALSNQQRTRPGPGPAPTVQLKRVLPAALPLQPTLLARTAAGSIATGAGGVGGLGRGGKYNSGPFIFNPYAAKRQAKLEAVEASATPDWACSDEGRVEVYLVNPLAVPLKIDQLQLHAKYLGHHAGTNAAAAPSAPASTSSLHRAASFRQLGVGSTHSGAGGVGGVVASAAAAAAFRTPYLNLVLPPNGRPYRAVLCGKPQLPGIYSIEGCLVTCWGVTWSVPFTTPLRKSTMASAVSGGSARGGGGSGSTGSSRTAGKSASRSSAVAGEHSVCVNVLPPLPLVKAIIRASPRGGPLSQLSATAAGPSAATPGPSAVPSPSPTSKPGQAASVSSSPAQQPAQTATSNLPQHKQQQQQQQQYPPSHQQQQISQAAHPQAAPHVSDASVVAVSPRDEELHASGTHTAFTEDLQRSPPVPVFEGQRLSWSLTLHNLGALPVTALSVAITNRKGAALKPLKGAPLPASFQGVHLEVDDSALQSPPPAAAIDPSLSSQSTHAQAALEGTAQGDSGAGSGDGSVPGPSGLCSALPLRPSCYLTLPLFLAVGQAPRGTFREAAVEVTISYLHRPPDQSTAEDGAPAVVVGRRMTVTLTFDIQPSLSVASTCFLEHYAPLRNGQRLPQARPLDPRVTEAGGAAAGRQGAAAATGGSSGVRPDGGEGDGDGAVNVDDDSDTEGASSLSTSLTADFSQGLGFGSRFASLIAMTRDGTGVPSFLQAAAAAAGTGRSSRVSAGGGSLSLSGLQHQLSGLGSGCGSGALSSRLAGLDLSLGGSRSLRVGARESSLLVDRPSSWVQHNPRDSVSYQETLSWQGHSGSQQQPDGASVAVHSDGATSGAAAAAAIHVLPSGRSAMLTPEDASDALGLVTDTVLCVTVQNTSSCFFRAWLARLDESAGPPPLTAAAAAAKDCPIEVLQPGDTARLSCLLPSAALTALAAQSAEAAATASAASTSAATAIGLSDSTNDATGKSATTATTSSATSSSAAVASAAVASAAGSSLRRVRLTIQPSGGEAGADHRDGADGGNGGPDGMTSRLSGGGGGGLASAEADRMAAAEGLAEEWAVVWELVVGLSEAAAGRSPPRGLVRLAAVDIARSMSTAAVQALRPSAIHYQFQALPPALPGAGAMPCLKDLTYRLKALGLMPQNVAGSVWGLRATLGEAIRLELLVHNRSNHVHELTYSLAATPATATAATAAVPQLTDWSSMSGPYTQPHSQLLYGHETQGFPVPYQYGNQLTQLRAASHQGVGTPCVTAALRYNGYHGRHPYGTTDGYTSGGSFVLGPNNPPVSYGRTITGGTGGTGGELHGFGGSTGAVVATPEPDIDAGVVLIGAVHNVHVIVEPRNTVRHPLVLTFVHPGFYQLYVHNTCAVLQGVDAHFGPGARQHIGAHGGVPQRIYASVDRLNVLCV